MAREIPSILLNNFLYFSFMSFLGWILESAYRSYRERRLVNAGFLSGPFVPIYGLGGVIISLIGLKQQVSLRPWPGR